MAQWSHSVADRGLKHLGASFKFLLGMIIWMVYYKHILLQLDANNLKRH